MSAFRVPAALLVSLLITLLAVPLIPAQAAAGPSPRLSVTVDRTEISTQLGRTFVFRSTIRNDGSASVSGLIANLNVVSLRNGVYVDPEDWSSQRTHYLDPLAASASTTITWDVHAVNGGVLGLVVTVLGENGVALTPATSPLARLTVAEKKTLNAGGILPLVLAIPALIGLLTLGVGLRRRRQPIR